MGNLDKNRRSPINFEPYGLELMPMNENKTDFKYKFTGQERDYYTNYNYMHFRFHASSMERFLKPDNLITNAFNPQSWNLYSYCNGNPVNFNDPSGHSGQGMLQQTYIVNISGATWIDWKSYLSFYGNLYGGNIAFGGGGQDSAGGRSSQTYTYGVGKWILSGFFDMWITQDVPPYEMTTYPKKAIWTYVTYTVQGEIELAEYKAELDRIDRAYNLWIKMNTGIFADFYHQGGPLSSIAWILSGGSGGSCAQLAEEAATFINKMNPNGNLTAEDVEYFGWFGSPSLTGWRGLISPLPHSVVEIKLKGNTIRTYDPYWRLFFGNMLNK